MKMSFECPKCHNLLEGETEWGGRQTDCPYCQNSIVIPLIQSQDNQNSKIAIGKTPSKQSNNKNLAPLDTKRCLIVFQIVQITLGCIQTAILVGMLLLFYNNRVWITNNVSLPTNDNTEQKNPSQLEKIKKEFNLNDKQIDFMKKQPATTFLQTDTPHIPVRLMVLVELSDDYRLGYYGTKSTHYCIKFYNPLSYKDKISGFIARNSEGGRMLIDKIKDGKTHFAEIAICYGDRSYWGGTWTGDYCDITKVLDVR